MRATAEVRAATSLHLIANTGAQPLEILGVFGATPVGVFLPDNQKLELPWPSQAALD